MRIAILYICTGDYSKFWQGFYRSAELYFCKQIEKQYFVFTDDSHIKSSNGVKVLRQDNLGWPLNTLYRFKMFQRISEALSEFDWVVFLNANCEFKVEIEQLEFFGKGKEIIACIHPGYFCKPMKDYPYERRTASTACVTNQVKYFSGGLMCGRPNIFLAICEQLIRNIDTDFDNGILALWHDESHWNAYLNNNFDSLKERLQLLSPSYMYPEDWNIPFQNKIELRDKSKTIEIAKIKGLSMQKDDAANSLSPSTIVRGLMRRIVTIFGLKKQNR